MAQTEDTSSTLHPGYKLLLHIVRVEDAQCGDPAWLEQQDGGGEEAKHSNAGLDCDYVPCLKEVEEDDWWDHEEQGDNVVDKTEASGEGESGLGAAAAAAAVTTAAGVAGEAEGEGGDEGDDEDVWEREDQVEESFWSKAHQWNETEKQLNPGEAQNQHCVGKEVLQECYSALLMLKRR